MFPKWYEINGIKCQGKLELAVATILHELGVTFKRGSAIVTPYGRYSPDFDCGSFFVEVKGQNTWLKACGIVPMMENARNPKLAEISDNSLKKMKWVDKNVKRLYTLIDTSIARKSIVAIDVPPHDLRTVSGSNSEFVKFLQDVLNENDLPRNTPSVDRQAST
jgi:hypothetical protein